MVPGTSRARGQRERIMTRRPDATTVLVDPELMRSWSSLAPRLCKDAEQPRHILENPRSNGPGDSPWLLLSAMQSNVRLDRGPRHVQCAHLSVVHRHAATVQSDSRWGHWGWPFWRCKATYVARISVWHVRSFQQKLPFGQSLEVEPPGANSKPKPTTWMLRLPGAALGSAAVSTTAPVRGRVTANSAICSGEYTVGPPPHLVSYG